MQAGSDASPASSTGNSSRCLECGGCSSLQQCCWEEKVGPLVIWEERKTLIRKEIQREWADMLCWEVAVLPQTLFPSVLPHGAGCPGDFRRELLRDVCQQRWSSKKACSSNTHPKGEKKKIEKEKRSRLFLTPRQFYSESSFVLWRFLECHIAVSTLHKTPKTSRLCGMGWMGHYHARTALPFRGKKWKYVG